MGVALVLAACPGPDPEAEPERPLPPAEAERRPAPDLPDPEDDPQAQRHRAGEALTLVVSRFDRELHVYVDNRWYATHPVAIGVSDNPTPAGDFRIHQVDWNPDWTPPDSEWAEDREPKPPGHPENPMGRARIVFQFPYTIHGTSELASLGRAASRGSIRVSNSNAVRLGRMIMEHGGAPRADWWYVDALGRRTEMRSVALPEPIPLRIR